MVELADIFRDYGPAYRDKYGARMLPSHLAAMRAIEQCRTEVLGGHLYYCAHCDETWYSYHSCRNRHCPKCQQDAAQQWLERQQELLLPVPYFMVTFTLPQPLRSLARTEQKTIYNLLFRTAAESLQQLAQNPRFVGGQIGMVGILQTWTRDSTLPSSRSLSRPWRRPLARWSALVAGQESLLRPRQTAGQTLSRQDAQRPAQSGSSPPDA